MASLLCSLDASQGLIHNVCMEQELKTFWDLVLAMFQPGTGMLKTADGPAIFSFDKDYDPADDIAKAMKRTEPR